MRIVALALSLLLLSGCTNMRRLERGKPIRSESAGAILRKHQATIAKPEWAAMKFQVDADLNGDASAFKVNARMRRDSAIWLSITPALGVEAARIILTEDSVQLFSKVPGNKFGYTGDYSSFDSLLGTELSFDMAQRILTGEGINLFDEDSKYVSKVDGREHLLISKYKRRVRRLVGVKDKEINPGDTLTVGASQDVQDRVISRSDDEDLLVKRYWFDGLGYQLTQTRFDDLYNARSVEIAHGSFEPEAGGWIPHRTRLTISSPLGLYEIQIEILRARYDKAYPMPFVIPDDVERRSEF